MFYISMILFGRIRLKQRWSFLAAVNVHHCPYIVLMFHRWQCDDWFKFCDANRLGIMIIIGCFVWPVAFLFACCFLPQLHLIGNRP